MPENDKVPGGLAQPPQVPSLPAQTPAVWHCAAGGQSTGPVTGEVLAAWAAEGRINGETSVWRPGLPCWVLLRQQEELVEEFRRRGIVLPPPLSPGQAPEALGDNAGMRFLLPVGRSIPAIVAGYLGLLSVIPGVGVLAIGFSIWAIMDIRRHPKRHGMGRAIFGIVGGVLGVVVWGALLVTKAMARR